MLVVATYLLASSYLFSSFNLLSLTDVVIQGAKPVIIELPIPQPSNWTWTSFSCEMKGLILVTYFFRLYKNLAGYLSQGAVLISCFAAFEIASEAYKKTTNCKHSDDVMVRKYLLYFESSFSYSMQMKQSSFAGIAEILLLF